MDLLTEDILKLIPHRDPFLFVDTCKIIEIGKKGIATKKFESSEFFFKGHFPDNPIVPGIIIVEALAQTAAVMVGVSLDLADKNLLIYFLGIDNCKFRRKVVPGDRLELKVEVLRGKIGSKVWKFSGVASVDGEIAAQADFNAMMELPSKV